MSGAAAFAARVAEVVRQIPKGMTVSYAQVALLAGRPRGARLVARALKVAPKGVPWWRVIRSDGSVAEEVGAEQLARLRREGVTVTGRRIPRARRMDVVNALRDGRSPGG